MNRVRQSVIAASLLALAAAAGAQTSPTDSRKPQPSVLTPMPENSSTGNVADKSASSPSRAEVKAGAKAKANASEKPVDQTGLTQKEKEGMSTKSRSEVKGELKADKKGNSNMSGTDQKIPAPANDPKNVPAVAPAVTK